MKNSLKILVFVFFYSLNTSSCVVSETAYPQPVSVSFQVFYDELSPYGRWVNYPPYGYGWIPVGYAGFYPYATGGHWVYTSFGWTWYSDYAWGWAPFHYGRWVFDVVYGWIWIPGTDWGPAWVVWASAPGYYGWVPMMPGYGYHIHSYPAEYWTFVSSGDFGRNDVYYGPRKNNAAIVNNAAVVDNKSTDQSRNASYYSGPRKEDIQAATGREIKPVTVQESVKPAQSLRNDQLKIYRPEVQKTDKSGKTPAPSRVTKLGDIKPAQENISVPRDKTDVQKEIPGIKKGEELPVRERKELPAEKKKAPGQAPEKKGQDMQAPQRKAEPDINKGKEQQQQAPERKKDVQSPAERKDVQPVPQKRPEAEKKREQQPRQQSPPVKQVKPVPQQKGEKRPR